MVNAEKLLNEAQYAFNNVGPGGTRDDRRNASHASRLARKIIRKYPTSTEAAQAHSILRRLGEEAFQAQMPLAHRHAEHGESHHTPEPQKLPARAVASADWTPTGKATQDGDIVSLDWRGLLSLLLATPKIVLGVMLAVGLFLFGIFGWFLFLPLLALIMLTSPARVFLQRKQRDDINEFVIQANAWIDRKIQDGTGLS
jgi:hypothetical protein